MLAITLMQPSRRSTLSLTAQRPDQVQRYRAAA